MSTILPLPEFQPIDLNGHPINNGFVHTYLPGTTTNKLTWQDAGGTIENTNPVQLNSAGRALIYGDGDYRFIINDSSNVLVYDQLTSATLSQNSISIAMAPVVAAPTLATARTLMGIDLEIQNSINNINLLAGPTGPQGGIGATGSTGPIGPSAGSGSVIQTTFTSSGTWLKPPSGSFILIQIWGAGAAGTAKGSGLGEGGGGGPGGYTAVMCLLSDLASSVSVTIGQGGIYTSSNVPGANGGITSFGSYLVQSGGVGGNVGDDGSGGFIIIDSPSGYLVSRSGLNLIFGSFDDGKPTAGTDNFGNLYASAPFSGTSGSGSGTAIPSIFGGSGGNPNNNGNYPGGGGGWFGGSGANGKIVVTTF